MFSECANPDCKKPFDYREGRFFRFSKAYLAGGKRPKTRCVQHLWLCGICLERYTLAYQEGWGVVDIAACGPSGRAGPPPADSSRRPDSRARDQTLPATPTSSFTSSRCVLSGDRLVLG
jgi:hypothetical protein